jgi:hypothetical protein
MVILLACDDRLINTNTIARNTLREVNREVKEANSQHKRMNYEVGKMSVKRENIPQYHEVFWYIRSSGNLPTITRFAHNLSHFYLTFSPQFTQYFHT